MYDVIFFRLDIANKKLGFGIYLPRLDIKSKYDLKGKILILPLVGHGDCQMSLMGVDTKIMSDVTFHEKQGKEIMRLDSMNVTFTLKGIKVQLDNLFNGNKILGNIFVKKLTYKY